MFIKCKTQSQKVEVTVIRKIVIEETCAYDGKRCRFELEQFVNGVLVHTEDVDMYYDAFFELTKIDYDKDIEQVVRDMNTIFRKYSVPLLASINNDRVLMPYLGEF